MVEREDCWILVPAHRYIEPETQETIDAARAAGYKFLPKHGIAAVDQVRCLLADKAVDGGAKATIWLDADTSCTVDNLDTLRCSGHKIITGLVARKNGTGYPAVTPCDHTNWEEPITEIEVCGAALLYVDIEVYHALRGKSCPIRQNASYGRFHPYFLPMTESNHGLKYFGEDVAFCWRAKEVGYKVMAATTVRAKHWGRYAYEVTIGNPASTAVLKKPENFPIIFSIHDSAEILPHFVAHYLKHGVTRFHCCLYGGIENPLHEYVRNTLASMTNSWTIETIPLGVFNGRLDSNFQDGVRQKFVNQDEWYVVADLDEFHELKTGLLWQCVEMAKMESAVSIEGLFVDRITADGSIPQNLNPSLPLGVQFPIATNASEIICQGDNRKVMAARYDVPIISGHHGQSTGRRYSVAGWVNHYKWWGLLMERAIARAQSYEEQGLPWAKESRRLLHHLRENGNKINLTTPKMYAVKVA